MKKIDLIKKQHSFKVGDHCPEKAPNVTEDCLLLENGVPIGFFLRDLSAHSERMVKLAQVADAELRSDRVPKSKMGRSSATVSQYSTIIGSCPPRPHMRRPYPSRSGVHAVKSAETFVRAMLALCAEGEKLLQGFLPDVYQSQLETIQSRIPEKWRFGKLFTSSISNYNISAPFHVDAANLEGCVNIIISKKWRANGGFLHVPDYDATFECEDNSMLVYPAWKSLHGVTPIEATGEGGYRNSLVFYPLKAFEKY